MAIRHAIGFACVLVAASLATPALADVKDGVDAWSRADYTGAVKQWQAPADAGDPDAEFNMGQAYRLGLGVAADADKAEYYYARAAAQGHIRAADTYGLILFQTGRTQQALPYLEAAAKRGDPRSQYLLGIAHFNGEIAPKDWVLAYALLIMANSQGLPQAAPAIAQMDQYIPLAQRQQAAGLAVQMQQDADATRATELASFDLSTAGSQAIPPGPDVSSPVAPRPAPVAAVRVPPPVEPVRARDDTALAEAREAVRQAALATGTEDPGEAGADFARPLGQPAQVAVAAPPPAKPPVTPAPRPAEPKPAPPKPAVTAASGPWKLQLGAFGVNGNAEKLWAQISGRPELAGKTRVLEPAGRLTKLLAGGFASKGEAAAACAKLQAAGQACIVTQ